MTEHFLNLEDTRFLQLAVELARKGRGRVEPNPMVGAVVVKNHDLVFKGYHALYGGPHAEIQALRKAGTESRGATLYVTLEPCSSHGKTPPCTQAVIDAGIARVVVGAVDPDPRHKSVGFSILSEAGIDVKYGDHGPSHDLLEPFRRHLDRDTPYVILKWAMTLDGRIAARDASSQWISGETSRRAVHRLRGHVDAVMVGGGTARIDDPSLNCRLRNAARVPARVVIDPCLKVPPAIGLVRNAREGKDENGFPTGPVLFVCGPDPDPAAKEVLVREGVEVVSLSASPETGAAFLKEALMTLKKKGISRLLVEGGSFLLTRFIESGLADQVEVFVAPKIVGGRKALSPIEGEGRPSMQDALELKEVKTGKSGNDMWIQGFF